MNNATFARQLDALLHQACEQGISPPVIAVFDSRSKPARAIYSDLHEQAMLQPGRSRGGFREVMEMLTVADSLRLFRQHAGIVGVGAANLLADLSLPINHWMAIFCREHLALGGMDDNGVAFESIGYYYRLPFSDLCPRCAQGEKGLTVLPVSVGSGRKVPVCGHTPTEAGKAAGLVHVIAHGLLPSIGLGENQTDFPVDDDLLALILKQHSKSPHVVVEAIAGLQKLGDRKDQWLLRVLKSRAELHALAQSVQKELCVTV